MYSPVVTSRMKILPGEKSNYLLYRAVFHLSHFRIAPNLLHRVADIEHLVIVIATVFDVNR